MKKYNLLIFMTIIISSGLFAQVNYSANDQITPYTGKYRAGVNPGYYGGDWDNFDLTDLSAGNAAIDETGVGVRAIRGTLPEHFGIVWDYNNWIPVYEYYDALGIKDNTLVVGVAHPDHRDPIDYCPNDPEESTMFANLYEPIWDGGANGTPVNDNNYMAKYVYDLVTTVGDHVKFWEVWNEPGYDLSGYKSSLQPGQPGNWYENDPDPCDIILRAPIQNYIRTLRITYEVVKTLSPDDYIVLSGIGTDAFLDALMRNTDNPNGGTVTAEFPLTSGAYFDVVGFHAYPHFDGSTQHWDNNLQQMVFTRHSDGAVDGFDSRVNQRKALLGTYGYDGNTYPEKLLIVTEMDVPRLPFGNYFGTNDLQMNYIMKSVAHATKIGITQTHVWQLAERTTVADANGSFDVMGFYENINDLNPGDETILPQGVAHHTASLLLKDGVYSQSETNMLNAPAGVRAHAFLMPDGSYVYMLWAETTQDMSEFASANYSFPGVYGQSVDAKQWDYSETNAVATMSSQNISLSATPIFFTMPRSNGTLTLNCPMGNIIEVPTTEAEGGAVVNWVAPTATSTCGIGSVNIENTGGNSGDFFPFGNTVINYTATDGCGNVQRCATRVAVASTGGINTTCHINLWDFKFAGQRDGHKYFISKYKTTYQEAEAIAASYGMKLLSIETQAENEFLRYQFTDIGFIGLSDAQSEGNLTWASGEPVSFTSFDDCVWCEPNTAANDYAEFHPWNAKWSFNDGTVPQYFMMEMDCNSPAPTSITITSFPSDIQMTTTNGTNVNWQTPTATTSCSGGVVNVSQTSGPANGSYFAANGQSIVVTYTFTDNCGNSLTQSFSVTINAEGTNDCPSSIPGFTVLGAHNGHKYFVSDNIDNWNNNKILAEANNGYLAVINDASENEFIKNSISEMVHIGLNDIQSEGNLSWTNGTPVSYTNLSDCDWCGLNTEQNDFGLMLPWDGKWSFDHPWAARKMILEMDCDNSTGGDLTITSCSNDLNFNTNGASEMVVNWNLPTATTTCASGVVNINQVLGPAPGDLVTATGQQVTVAYTITDDCGNNQECSFTITVTNDGATSCAPSIAGFTKLGEYNGRGYYMSNASASWEDAKVLSENAGGYLASMGDQAENDFLKSNLNGNMAFIGYNDAATEGVGQWANNESVGFDLSYGNSSENDYAVMNFWAGSWQMVSQWVHKPFVMEIDCGGSTEQPDLSVSNITNLPSLGWPNTQVDFNFDLNNFGDVDVVGSFDIKIYLSVDEGLSSDDALVGGIPTGGTPVGTIANVPASIGIPDNLSLGNYYLIIVADVDNVIAESNEGNNELSMLFSISGSGGGCGTIPGYQKLGDYNGHSYYLSDMSVPWSQAKSLSENENGYLATMNTQAENDFLKSSIGNSMVFIGYHDSNTEGVGQWANNESVTLDLSYGNSPENDYAVMNFWAGTWQLVSGGVYKHFVMEKECSAAQPQPAIAPKFARIQNAEIYPNPADDIINVRWVSSEEQEIGLAVYDIVGNLISSQMTAAPKGFYEKEINISNLKAGVYFVRVFGNDGNDVLRFVKAE